MDTKKFIILIELNKDGAVNDCNVVSSQDNLDLLKNCELIETATGPKQSKCPNCSYEIEFTFLQTTLSGTIEDPTIDQSNNKQHEQVIDQKLNFPNDHDYEGSYIDYDPEDSNGNNVENDIELSEDVKEELIEDYKPEDKANKIKKKQLKIPGESKPATRSRLKVKRIRNSDGSGKNCSICGKNFLTNSNVTSHEYYCKNKKKLDLHCDYCDKTFALLSTLKAHMTRIHSEKTHICHKCGASFSRQCELEQHLLRYTNPKPYECFFCQERYAVKNSLRSHIKIQHVTSFNGYFCTLCPNGKKYPTKQKLAEHSDRVHSGNDRYQCTNCPKRFKYPESLRNHVIRYHTPESQIKWFSCEQCNFRAPNVKALEKHRIIHLNDDEKPFKCSFCQKGFGRRYELNRHEMIHREEKPFKCSFCNHMCRTNYLVQKHMRIHQEGRAYACFLCDKTYRDRDSFKKHLRGHKSQLTDNVQIEIPPHPTISTATPVTPTIVSGSKN